jgi:hypothetical protein
VVYEPKRTIAILDHLDDVRQKLEKDYPRKLDQEDDAAVPDVMSRTEGIRRRSALQDPENILAKRLWIPGWSP